MTFAAGFWARHSVLRAERDAALATAGETVGDTIGEPMTGDPMTGEGDGT